MLPTVELAFIRPVAREIVIGIVAIVVLALMCGAARRCVRPLVLYRIGNQRSRRRTLRVILNVGARVTGLSAFLTVFVLILLPTPSPMRWYLIAARITFASSIFLISVYTNMLGTIVLSRLAMTRRSDCHVDGCDRTDTYIALASKTEVWQSLRLTVFLAVAGGLLWPFFSSKRLWSGAAHGIRIVIGSRQVAGMFGSVLAVTVAMIALNVVDRTHRDVEIASNISAVLDRVAKLDERKPAPVSAFDPLYWCRRRLMRISRNLMHLARGIERRYTSLAPHPISALLRASATRIQVFVTGRESLRPELPDDIVGQLAGTVDVLAGGLSPSAYDLISNKWSAFLGDGQPKDPPSPSRFPRIALALGALGRGAEPTEKFLSALVRLAIFAVIFYLVLSGKVHLLDVIKKYL